MTVPDHYAPVFSRLDGVFESRGHWYARCPAHDDRRQSLSLKVGDDGSLVVRCHAGDGCGFGEICAAMNLHPSDFFPPDRRKRPRPPAGSEYRPVEKQRLGEFVTAYPYKRADGTLLYENCRFRDPKDFRVRTVLPDGTREWGFAGVAGWVLYRTPELAAVPRNRVVFVVEGEKSADNLHARLGVATTTNVVGAGKWKPEYTEQLRGRRVVMLYDFDPVNKKSGRRAGWEHAKTVCNALHGVAASVRAVLCPGITEGQDVDDFLARYPEAETRRLVADLKAAVDAAPEWTPLPHVVPDLSEEACDALAVWHRLSAAPGVDDDHALGRLTRLFRRVENQVIFEGHDPGTLKRLLVELAAAAVVAAEDVAERSRPKPE